MMNFEKNCLLFELSDVFQFEKSSAGVNSILVWGETMKKILQILGMSHCSFFPIFIHKTPNPAKICPSDVVKSI